MVTRRSRYFHSMLSALPLRSRVSMNGRNFRFCVRGWLADRLGDRLGHGMALDCGANIGNHSVFFCGMFRKVYSFEPNPRTFRLLQFNSHDLQNVECLNLGLSDRDGSFKLSVPRTNVGGASLTNSDLADETADTISVEMRTLDGLNLEIDDLLFVKVDVEGHELSALRDAEDVIEKYLPLVAFEQSAAEIASGASEVIDWLKSRGYSRFFCIEKSPKIGVGFGRKLTAMIRRLIFGQHLEVNLTDRFDKKYYPLKIAEAQNPAGRLDRKICRP